MPSFLFYITPPLYSKSPFQPFSPQHALHFIPLQLFFIPQHCFTLFHLTPSSLSTSPPFIPHISILFFHNTLSSFFQSLYPLLPCYPSPLFHINLFSFIPLSYLSFLFSSSQSFPTHQRNFKLKKHSSHEYAAVTIQMFIND